MYSRGTAAFWNKLKKEVILCLQIRQAVAGNIYKRKWHFNIIGLSRGMEKCRKKTFQGGIQNETEKDDVENAGVSISTC